MGGCISVSNKAELNAALKDLITDANFRRKGHICSTFVQMNKELNIILKTLFDRVQITLLLLIRQTTIRHLIACNGRNEFLLYRKANFEQPTSKNHFLKIKHMLGSQTN
jgi:hypothetical protein